MIRIARSGRVPRILTGSGTKQTKGDIEAYAAHLGPVPFAVAFRSSLYNAKSVKNALIRLQSGKCCFCESEVTHISYGDVEHFRPKGGFRQDDADALHQPGYFWLAYAWLNLLFCCQLCNQRYKRNAFPLEDPSRRVTVPGADLSNEQPIFINPADENPEDFIGFRGDTPFAINGNDRAERTIEALGLRREPLRGRRSALLEKLRLIYLVANQEPPSPFQNEASNLLTRAASPREEYSLAVRASVADGFQFV